MATLNARMRLLYDKNYTSKGSPMRRYDNPYYIASSQRLLYDILQQQTAKTPTKISKSKTPPMMITNAPTATPASSAPAKASERKPPSKVPLPAKAATPAKSSTKPVKAATTPVKGGSKTGNLRGKTTALSKAQQDAIKAGDFSNIPPAASKIKPAFGKKQGKTTKLTDAGNDDDSISNLTKAKQAQIKGHENAEEQYKFNEWHDVYNQVVNAKNALITKRDDLVKEAQGDPTKNAAKILALNIKIKKAKAETQEELNRDPRKKYKRRYSKKEYASIRAALKTTNKRLKTELQAEERTSGSQETTAYEKIKGRKRYYKARLAELDASNSGN